MFSSFSAAGPLFNFYQLSGEISIFKHICRSRDCRGRQRSHDCRSSSLNFWFLSSLALCRNPLFFLSFLLFHFQFLSFLSCLSTIPSCSFCFPFSRHLLSLSSLFSQIFLSSLGFFFLLFPHSFSSNQLEALPSVLSLCLLFFFFFPPVPVAFFACFFLNVQRSEEHTSNSSH